MFFEKFLKNLFSDTVKVRYWDGTEEKYGEGQEKFKIYINKDIPNKDIVRDPFLTLGEAYMDKTLDFDGNVREIIESIYKNKESFLHKADSFSKIYKVLPNTLKKSKKTCSIIMIWEMIFTVSGWIKP